MNQVLVLLLMLLVVLSPLPLGSNREWSWTLSSLVAAIITLLWLLGRGWRPGELRRFVHPLITALFLAACAWVAVQTFSGVPDTWKHPIWAQTGEVLGISLPGRISVAAEDG